MLGYKLFRIELGFGLNKQQDIVNEFLLSNELTHDVCDINQWITEDDKFLIISIFFAYKNNIKQVGL